MIAANEDLKGSLTLSAPLPNPCLSYWQRTTRAFPHLNINKSSTLPSSSKYVIIGSGISGALTAFELTENGVDGKDIIILEAREAASGASSRNAGHVRPDAFRGFKHYSSLHGPDQALKIIANERLVLEKVDHFVKKYDVPCDFHLTSTFDVCMTPEFAAYEADNFEAFKKAGGDVSHVSFFEGDEAKKRTGIQDAFAAYEWPAGSSHPAKLAQWLLNSCIKRGVKLFTHCPVSKVTQSEDKSWEVHTSRGAVVTPTVIHCTNAYASLLLPQLESHLTPNRAQAHSLIAPPAFSAEGSLTKTFSLRYSLHHFYSLIQRRGDGTLILGVSRANPTLSTETRRGAVTYNDGKYNEEILEDALKQWKVLFPRVDADINRNGVHGAGLDHAWSGIIGMTGDFVPFVGPLDGMEGQWVCAGFGGHGMARIFTCAPGVVKMMLGKEWSDTGLPECFQFTAKRVAKMMAAQGLQV
ncbi:FAD dependent oxidoreductase [Mollisia scopiformis]|uniref:FAD dependent oxidoreductase n=1 Tax=Mollisia scopiformis TaxID=149040 RepID=A0A132B4H6_MOLSC|nr:FAD dependent oxidoreductase [Mollisia scopiformis]KUJ06814.1 FAD dependent oxidoreductase [Mollisia scopiformis]